LHAGRLDGYNSRRFERLRYKNDPRRALLTRLQELDQRKVLSVIPRIRNEVLPEWEYLLQTISPLKLIPLRVSDEAISRGTGSVRWDDAAVVDVFVYLLHNIPPEQQRRLYKALKEVDGQGFIAGDQFLLTLEVVVESGLHPSIAAGKKYLAKHQRELAYGSYRLNINLLEKNT
jgi:hypothetical protein